MLKFELKLCENKQKSTKIDSNRSKVLQKFALNEDKTEFVIFVKPRMKASQEIQTIEITDTKIKETNHVKYLGVIIENILERELEDNVLKGNSNKNTVSTKKPTANYTQDFTANYKKKSSSQSA